MTTTKTTWLSLLLLPLALMLPTSEVRPMPEAASSKVSLISLERGCFGCQGSLQFVMRRGGKVTLTMTGNARQGVADTRSHGTMRVQDFDALARLAMSQQFDALNDVYEDPEIRDGPWSTIRIVHDGHDKQVFRRDDAGPASLKALEAAIDKTKATISFVPD